MVLLHICITSRGVSREDFTEKVIPSHIHVAEADKDWYQRKTKKILSDLVTIVVDNIDIIERRSKGEKDCTTDHSGLIHLEPSHDSSEIVVAISTRPKAKKANYILMTLDDNDRENSTGSSSSSSSSSSRSKSKGKSSGKNVTANIQTFVPQGSVMDQASFDLDVWIFKRDRSVSLQILPTDAGIIE